MKITNIRSTVRVSLFLLSCALLLPACSAQRVSAAGESSPSALTYQTFTLPDPNGIEFELPADWQFWGNAGYLSPDGGTTLAGIRLAWIDAGQESERYLYNEDSILHEKEERMINGIRTQRMLVESTLTKAGTTEVIWHAYELIYAFPSPDGKMMIGAVVSAPEQADLADLQGIAEHMVASLTWQGAAE